MIMKKIFALLACIAVMPVLSAQAGQKITENIELSCLVEAEASYSDTDGDDASDIVLATLELGLDAEITDWFSAHVLLLYEEDETDGIEVDEAFASITPGNSRIFVNAGRFAQSIGAFPSSMITDPLTLELGETAQKSSVALGWGNDSVEALVSVYKGDIQKTGDDHVNTWVGALNVNGELDDLSIEAGVSYTNNFADSDGLVDDFAGGETDDLVSGYSGYVVVGLNAVQLSAEYMTAADAFTDGDRAGSTPAAYNVELAWDAPSPLALAIRLGGGDEFDVDNQYGATVSYDLYEGVALGFEYLRNENSDDSSEDIFTLQLAAGF
ncbi:MAG: hypothetical protein C1941_01270 [Prosthecochloris sp.]|nr:hypothetical protein [Prosthecochloris sp.]